MNSYIYTALLQSDNSYAKGQIRARSMKKAIANLEKDGFLVINIKQESRFNLRNFSIYSSISRLEKIYFTRHLYSFLDAGITIDQSIKIAGEQIDNKKFKEILRDVHEKIRNGQTLSSALGAHTKYFSKYFINLIRIGEESGNLDGILKHLLEQQEKEYELISKVRGAMIYPAIIVLAAFGIVIFMMTFVVPTITSVLTENGGTLPLPTRIIIAISNFLVNYGFYALGVLVIFIFLTARLARTKKGRWFFESIYFNMPYFNKIYIEYNIARFTRSMTAPLMSGLAVDKSLELAVETTHNLHYRASYEKGIEVVRKGVPLSEVLVGYPDLYTPNVVRMTEIGERTGKFDHMFMKLADFYERSVFNTFNNLSSIIEPVLLLAIGLMVGFIAVSILTPIWKFAETI